ncbi:3-methyl-2-oxobutanoate hydroxymethyltransferase [Campylobacter geochelonis]|uniref:3-methyl-2-oxobutanoate hydroxymethyltransferase n=1 Tax=Campylobacter geochelonis TaxID=1780362 RepID=A0A128ELV0_9BACT|nr:3-methyl-2-oxobutanoate hydroxymethyltransferase [Campylobacter geochelonis]QKF71584.1 3-methyl-2-oxobutanoate hydroxymethyltransferase [Campylobacter geochelonis]CZE49348.1 3-methyl-2-oxobutanoate hydroxymethyltransferase [Campylobacter geochelonis]
MENFTTHTKKVTINYIKSQKNKSPLTMITAYDALFAKIFDANVDMILVGDSLEMSFGGKDDTLKATVDSMIYHTKAVCNGAKTSLIITDMPFGSVTTKEETLKNAIKIYQETNADAVKIEGGSQRAEIISHLCKNAIAVVGHIGLTPQSARSEGGYIVKGKDEENVKKLIEDAKAVEKAGAFCIVVEGVVSKVATQIARSVNVPVIGIGAGNEVDGQVLVWSDAFGFFDEFKPKFVKRFLHGKNLVEKALLEYINEVKTREFPSKENSYQ